MMLARRAHAFTLLDLMLASVIGAMVLLTCIGMFGAIRRAEQRSRVRFETMLELSTTQRAVEKAMRTLIMGQNPPPRPSGLQGDPARANPARPADAPELPTALLEHPRLILSSVEKPLALMAYRDENGNIHTMPPQQLEVVLDDAPVFPATEVASPDDLAIQPVRHRGRQNNRHRAGDRGSHSQLAHSTQPPVAAPAAAGGDPANPANPDDPLLDDAVVARAPGMRGVFELTWDVPEARPEHAVSIMSDETGPPSEEAAGGWTLWWRALPNLPPPEVPGLASPDPEPEPLPPPPIKLASGLRTCKWEAVRSGDKFSNFSATAWDDLPAYMSLEVETRSGQWNQWMFEVSGSKGGEPGSPVQASGDGLRIQGTGQLQPGTPAPGTPSGTVTTPGTVPSRTVPGMRPINPPSRPGPAGSSPKGAAGTN
jgi:type II secretory pathway component PulJ